MTADGTGQAHELSTTSHGLGVFSAPLGFAQVTRILLRRWYVLVPLAVGAVIVAVVVTDDIEPEYTSDTSVLFVGSNTVQVIDAETGELEIEDVNPLITLGSSLNAVAAIMALAMSDADVLEQLAEEGLSTDVAVGAANRSPIVGIRVRDSHEATARATSDRMVELLAEELDRRQDELGAPEADRVFVETISGGTVEGPDFGQRNRARFGLMAFGLVLAGAIVVAADLALQIRRTRAVQRIGGSGSALQSTPMVSEGSRRRLEAVLVLLTGDAVSSERTVTTLLPGIPPGHRKPELWIYQEAFHHTEHAFVNFLRPDPEAVATLTGRLGVHPTVIGLASHLTFRQRSVFVLSRVADLPLDDAATLLGTTVEGVIQELSDITTRMYGLDASVRSATPSAERLPHPAPASADQPETDGVPFGQQPNASARSATSGESGDQETGQSSPASDPSHRLGGDASFRKAGHNGEAQPPPPMGDGQQGSPTRGRSQEARVSDHVPGAAGTMPGLDGDGDVGSSFVEESLSLDDLFDED